jgi:hypothetical protein
MFLQASEEWALVVQFEGKLVAYVGADALVRPGGAKRRSSSNTVIPTGEAWRP